MMARTRIASTAAWRMPRTPSVRRAVDAVDHRRGGHHDGRPGPWSGLTHQPRTWEVSSPTSTVSPTSTAGSHRVGPRCPAEKMTTQSMMISPRSGAIRGRAGGCSSAARSWAPGAPYRPCAAAPGISSPTRDAAPFVATATVRPRFRIPRRGLTASVRAVPGRPRATGPGRGGARGGPVPGWPPTSGRRPPGTVGPRSAARSGGRLWSTRRAR